jgi:tetratricopeptide (TPR) repeat protein
VTTKAATSLLSISALAAVLAVAVWTGYRGIDFGHHWDEHWTLDCVRGSISSGLLIPRRYEYPSVTRDLALLCAGPAVFRTRYDSQTSAAAPEQIKALHQANATLAKQVDQIGFTLRTRTVFLVISLASCVWLYLLVLARQGDGKEALLAATLIAASWQVAYHARWIAPDAILMQFSALTLLLAVVALRSQRRPKLWLGLGAIAAGLGCSTKYAGAILLLPILLTAYVRWREGKALVSGTAFPGLLALFCLAFILTTPGAWVEPGRFLADIFAGARHYHTQTHWGNTVSPGAEHLWRMLEYFCLAAFSRYPVVAVVFFVMTLVGAWSIARSHWPEAAILLCAPVVYVAGFAMQRVMNVRNLLLVLPLLAVLSARGTVVSIGAIRWRAGRIAASLAVVLACLLNLIWLARASEGIAHRTEINHARNIEAYLRQHPDTLFYLSPGVAQTLPGPTVGSLSNVAPLTPDLNDDGKVILLWVEGDRLKYPANRVGFYDVVSGTHEVDFDYYPGWSGDAHVLAVSVRKARPVIASIIGGIGWNLAKQGKYEEALVLYDNAFRICPSDATMHLDCGDALFCLGRVDEAVVHYRESVRLRPSDAEALCKLGIALAAQGHASQATELLERAIRLNPVRPDAYDCMARVLVTKKDATKEELTEAINMAGLACTLSDGREALYLMTLAEAYAADGQFDNAIQTIGKAIHAARSAAQPQLVSQLEQRLERYRAARAN